MNADALTRGTRHATQTNWIDYATPYARLIMSIAKKSGQSKTKHSKESSWIRLYRNILTNYRIGNLSPQTGWGWVRLLLIADQNNGLLPPIAGISYHLRMSQTDAKNLVEELIELGLLDVVQTGDEPSLKPHDWDRWQYRWDGKDRTVKERVKRHREKVRNGHVTVEERSCNGRVTVFPSVSVSASVSSTSLAAREDAYHEEGVSAEVGAGIHPTHGKPTYDDEVPQ